MDISVLIDIDMILKFKLEKYLKCHLAIWGKDIYDTKLSAY